MGVTIDFAGFVKGLVAKWLQKIIVRLRTKICFAM